MKRRAGKNIVAIFLAVLLSYVPVAGQEMPAYRIFTSKGKEVHYGKMMKSIVKGDVIFFGEVHNNPIAHWLELEVFNSLYKDRVDMVLALEMFEADDQIVLDEYLSGLIDERNFLKEVKIWDNYSTDYRPLIEFAKKNKVRVVASNIPRRYANLVYKKRVSALDSLPEQSLKWIAPLPVEVDAALPGYKRMIVEMKGHGGGNPENLVKSQAMKDATMAYFIKESKTENNRVYHINGAYHSQDNEGIIWYLRKLNPALNVVTVQVVEQTNIGSLNSTNTGKADFIICVPENMTKTY